MNLNKKQIIGLYGGSFNPAHAGHRLVVDQALKHTNIDSIWVLPAPHNPLKEKSNLASYKTRFNSAKHVLEQKKSNY